MRSPMAMHAEREIESVVFLDGIVSLAFRLAGLPVGGKIIFAQGKEPRPEAVQRSWKMR